MTLWKDFLNHKGRSIHKWSHYFPVYEQHFSRYINRPLFFLEIGCGNGGSLQLWKGYFGPNAQIVGLDIRPDCAAFEEDRIAVRIGDQADTAFLSTVIDEFGTPDIVLDDGSHVMSHIIASFDFLYARTAHDGIYMVEDLHTAYWPEFEGGFRKAGTFIEHSKNLIDEINADYCGAPLQPSTFTRTTQSIHFYDSIIAFERGRTLLKDSKERPLPPVAQG